MLAAAALKTHGLIADPLSGDSIFSSPRLQIAAIEMEILLGLWLLSGRMMRAAWVAAILFLGILSAVSLYMGLTGQASCGCFGRIEVNPWWTFGIDSLILVILFSFRPNRAAAGLPTLAMSGPLRTIAGALVILTIAAGIFFLAFDNPYEALARLRGESVSVEPFNSDLGEAQRGVSREFQLQLANRMDQTIRIVGGTSTCACTAIQDLPVILLPHESTTIRVRGKFTGGTGRFQHRFTLFTDSDNQRWVTACFSGRVIDSPPK